MNRAKEIEKEVIAAAHGDMQAAMYALEDGKYLVDAGYTDDDQENIEIAHDSIKNMINR